MNNLVGTQGLDVLEDLLLYFNSMSSRLKHSFSRRTFIKQMLTKCFGLAAISSSPIVFAKKEFKVRVLGTHVTLQEELKARAQKDLGITLEYSPGGSAQVLHQASTKPESFDLYEQWSNSMNVLWRSSAIQPIQTKRLRYWDDINPLTKTGYISKNSSYGQGDSPHKLLHVQKDGTLGSNPTGEISFLPYVHNVDSFGYNSKLVPEGVPYKTESWTWLLNEDHSGKVALINEPSIGLFDVALAAEGLGLMTFRDMGNMSRKEIDQLFNILIRLKQKNHFRGLWTSVPQSVEFMEKDGVVVQSMFSPGVSDLNGKGIPCVYAAPKEGYRAWHGVMCLSAKTHGGVKDAAYEYMNWWLSGWPGAFIARQGYYISTPQLSKPHLSKEEWAYWYDGKAATEVLKNTRGQAIIQPGQVRRGGSYENRFGHVAVWNTVLPEYEYTLFKWGEFLSS